MHDTLRLLTVAVLVSTPALAQPPPAPPSGAGTPGTPEGAEAPPPPPAPTQPVPPPPAPPAPPPPAQPAAVGPSPGMGPPPPPGGPPPGSGGPPGPRPPPPNVAGPPPEPPRDPGFHRHDGFYLRLASGLGVYAEEIRSEDSNVYGGRVKGSTAGIATLAELAIGGTVGESTALGGGVYTVQLITGRFRPHRNSAAVPPPELDPEVRNLAIIGPFVDWYKRPERGFHVQGAVGLAVLTGVEFGFARQPDDYSYHALGLGLVFGVGYDWWVSDNWSLGVMGRLTGSVLVGEDDSNVQWLHGTATSFSPMFTATYH